ncbi:MAG: lipopolysaccharide biosynthesis [Cyanobacteria bacterium P01_H01_bin.121]
MAASMLKRYRIALGKYKWVGFISIAISVTGAALYALSQADPVPEYQATGILVPNQSAGVFSETGQLLQAPEQVPTPEALLTEDIVVAIAELVQIPPRQLTSALRLREREPRDGEDGLPQIVATYTSKNEIEAETILDALLPLMVQRSLEIKVASLDARITAISERLPQVEQELRAAEQDLESFNRREEVDILAAQSGGLVSGIVQSQQQQRALVLQLEGVGAQIRSLEQRLGLDVDEAFVSSALSADPIIARLRSQILEVESNLAILRRSLRPQHPDIIGFQDQLEALEGLLQSRVAEVVRGEDNLAPLTENVGTLRIRQESSLDPTRQQLANTLVSLQTQQDTLQQQLQAATQNEQFLRQQYETIPNRQLEQQRLAQVVGLKKNLYDRIQAALIDAQAAQAETVPSIRIAQFTDVNQLPVATPLSEALIVGGGLVFGTVLGGGLIFALSILEGRLYTRQELEQLFKQEEVPIIGALPQMELEPEALRLVGSNLKLPLLLQQNSAYLNAYERFRSKVARAGSGQSAARVIMLTSSGKGEGKTLVAYNLAIANARSGKRTLLVEADLRQPSQLANLGLDTTPSIAREPLLFYGDMARCVQMVPTVENLYTVSSVGPQQQPAAILESNELKHLFQHARGRFDMVIVDMTSFLWYNDPLLLEPLVDGVILVTRPLHTQRSVLLETLKLLEETQTPFVGAVINDDEDATSNPPVLAADAEVDTDEFEVEPVTAYSPVP